MKKLNLSIKDLTHYLVSLFYKTDCKYSCNKTKIGKILSILAFKYANNDILLFNEEIRKYDNCGTIIEDSAFFVYSDEYICKKDRDNKEYILEEINECNDLPIGLYERYKEVSKYSKIPEIIKKDVEEVFRYFGAYSKTDLSEVLNPIVDKLTTESYGKIDLSKISSILNEITQDNEIIKYMKFNTILNEINIDVLVKRKKLKK